MDTKDIIRMTAITSVIVILCMSCINNAYSYSTSVTSPMGPPESNFLSINTYSRSTDDSDFEIENALNFEIPSSIEYNESGLLYNLDPNKLYSIKVSSNFCPSVKVLGCFKYSNELTSVIESIDFNCETDSKNNKLKLKSVPDADGLNLTMDVKGTGNNMLYEKDLLIRSINVNFYSGCLVENGTIIVNNGPIDIIEACSPNNFKYDFYAYNGEESDNA